MLRAAAILPSCHACLSMKKLSSILAFAAAAACVSGPATASVVEMRSTMTRACNDVDSGHGQRVDGCLSSETGRRGAAARDRSVRVAYARVTTADHAAAYPVVEQLQTQAESAQRSDAEILHHGRMKLLRTLAFMVAGALVFKLLLKRSFLLGALAGFVVELVLVGAAVMN